MNQEKDRPESIPVTQRKNAVWVNLDPESGRALICEEGQHGEIDSVWIFQGDIDALVEALYQAKAKLAELVS